MTPSTESESTEEVDKDTILHDTAKASTT
jgi:hypothetical protein